MQVNITGVCGAGVRGDIAVDDIDVSCCPEGRSFPAFVLRGTFLELLVKLFASAAPFRLASLSGILPLLLVSSYTATK